MIGSLDKLLLQGTVASSLRSQRVVLVTSAKGAKRRSHGYVQYLLRQKLNCQVFCEVVTEPGMVSVAACEKLAKHTGANVLVGLGGSAVMDVGKLACSRAEMDHFVAVPTVACGGAENTRQVNLFDFDKEMEIADALPAAASRLSCLVDAQLGWEDKIDRRTDLLALANTLSIGLEHGSEPFHLAAAKAISAANGERFSVADRELFLRTSLALADDLNNNTGTNTSFGLELTNAICREIPLPRSLVRAALFYPTFAIQLHVAGNNSLLQTLTGTSSPEAALHAAATLTKQCGLERGVVGLLPLFFSQDTANTKVLPQLGELFKHTASEHSKKHGGVEYAQEMLFGMAAEEEEKEKKV